jgi:hypothetical protein
MSEEQQRANGTKSTVTGVTVYFTDKRDLFPAGVFYAFHRQYGDEERVRFHEAFEASWDRLRRLINQAPGRLIATSSGFDWWPRTPDYFRLDVHRMRKTVRHILEEGDWQFDDPQVGRPQRYDFAERLVKAMQDPQ